MEQNPSKPVPSIFNHPIPKRTPTVDGRNPFRTTLCGTKWILSIHSMTSAPLLGEEAHEEGLQLLLPKSIHQLLDAPPVAGLRRVGYPKRCPTWAASQYPQNDLASGIRFWGIPFGVNKNTLPIENDRQDATANHFAPEAVTEILRC